MSLKSNNKDKIIVVVSDPLTISSSASPIIYDHYSDLRTSIASNSIGVSYLFRRTFLNESSFNNEHCPKQKERKS